MAERTAQGELFSKSKIITIMAALALCASCGIERDANGDMIPHQTINCSDISKKSPGTAPADEDPMKVSVKKNGTVVWSGYIKEKGEGISYSASLEGTYTDYTEGEVLPDDDVQLTASHGLIGSSIRVVC